MNQELLDELNQEIAILINSGFFKKEEIFEIIEEQFIDEDFVDDDESLEKIANILSTKFGEKIAFEKYWEEITDFDRLVNIFNTLNKKSIIAIHNGGYTIEEGVEDAFQVYHHLKSNDFSPIGFCFYDFQSIEKAINSKSLPIFFGDFENNPDKSKEIGKIIAKVFKDNEFSIEWNENHNEKILINPFIWRKRFDNKEYEIEGAFNSYIDNNINNNI